MVFLTFPTLAFQQDLKTTLSITQFHPPHLNKIFMSHSLLISLEENIYFQAANFDRMKVNAKEIAKKYTVHYGTFHHCICMSKTSSKVQGFQHTREGGVRKSWKLRKDKCVVFLISFDMNGKLPQTLSFFKQNQFTFGALLQKMKMK